MNTTQPMNTQNINTTQPMTTETTQNINTTQPMNTETVNTTQPMNTQTVNTPDMNTQAVNTPDMNTQAGNTSNTQAGNTSNTEAGNTSNTNTQTMNTQNMNQARIEAEHEKKFIAFYENWMRELKVFHEELSAAANDLSALSEQDKKVLIFKLKCHFKLYYTTKWAAATRNVFPFFVPTWLNSLQLSTNWFSDWKPSMVFHLIFKLRSETPNMSALSEDQIMNLQGFRGETKMIQETIEKDMIKAQMLVAARINVEVVRWYFRIKTGRQSSSSAEMTKVEEFMEMIRNGFQERCFYILKAADAIRLKVLKVICDILNPSQCIVFLVRFCQHLLDLKEFGNRLRVRQA